MLYNAFISYSHAADDKLAPALQSGLHRFARPWYRLRALHVFRDKTNLTVNPHLWSDIQKALDQADWFVLLASPKAAASRWVDREVEHWLGRRSADRILMVLTDGSIAWDPAAQRFDAEKSSAVPQRLQQAFSEEPLYLDLTWARGESDLSLHHPRFRDAIAEISSALSGRPKDEMIGEDVRQYRRTRRIAWSAASALLLLTLGAVIASIIAVQKGHLAENRRVEAVQQKQIAEQQTRIAEAGRLAAQSGSILAQFPDELPLATLLAVESTRIYPTTEGNASLRAALSLLPRMTHSYPPQDPDSGRVRALAFSADNQHLAVAREDGTVSVLATANGNALAVLAHEDHPGSVTELPGGGVQWRAPGFGAEVTAVAFSPDGRLLASGDNDSTARIWDVASGRELHRLSHDDGVSSVAFHPSAALLATGSKDGTARIWDSATGKEVFRIKHDAEVREVAFSPDGRSLAAISTDSEISLSDVRTKSARKRWALGDAGLGLAFSADGSKLATASGEYAAVWDSRTAKLLFRAAHLSRSERAGGLNWIDDVAFSPDGKLLASGGRDATARVWDLESTQEVIRLQHGAPVSSVAFNADGTQLTTASADGAARLWDVSSGKERLRAAQSGGSEVVQFSPDGNLVASGGSNGTVDLWRLDRGDQLSRTVQEDDVRAVATSPDGKLLASGSRGVVRVWSTASDMKPLAVKLPVVNVDALVFSTHASHLAAMWSSRLFLMDVTKDLAFTPVAGSGAIRDAVIGPQYLAAFDPQRGAVRIWETAGGREVASIADPALGQLHIDITGTALAAQHTDDRGDGFIGVWALPEARELGRIPTKGFISYALGPEGRLIAVSGAERANDQGPAVGYLDVYDVARHARLTRIARDDDTTVVVSAQGDVLFAVRGSDISVLDLPDGKLRTTLPHKQEIQRLRLSPENEILATVASGSVYVWNYATGQQLSTLTDAGYVRDVHFTADGRYLLTGSADHSTALWLWKTEDLREAACTRLARNLTASEWTRYVGTEPYRKTCPDLQLEGNR